MIPNALLQKWGDGQATVNGWLSIGNSFTAEIMAAQGFDSLTIDVQHGFLDYSDAKAMLQTLRASGSVVLARPPWLEPGIIMKLLDAGAYGIICPMINTGAEAAQLVEYMRYPPKGTRSYGPTRANFAVGKDYDLEANDNILAIAMIETGEAVQNVEEICNTPGLNGIYIGPSDLSLGVTNGRLRPGMDREEPEMVETIQKILTAAKGAGIYAAIHCLSEAYAARAVGWGFDMVTVGGDVPFLSRRAADAVAETHRLIDADKG